MKITSITLCAALSLGASLAATAQTIPAQYQGFWEEAEKCQMSRENLGVPISGAEISATRVERYENHCELASIGEQTANSIELNLSCMQEGDTHKETLELRSFDNTYLVINEEHYKSWPLVRCE